MSYGWKKTVDKQLWGPVWERIGEVKLSELMQWLILKGCVGIPGPLPENYNQNCHTWKCPYWGCFPIPAREDLSDYAEAVAGIIGLVQVEARDEDFFEALDEIEALRRPTGVTYKYNVQMTWSKI